MVMSAEFNLLGRGKPCFMLHFKPQIEDFSIKKSQSSIFDKAVKPRKGTVFEENSSIEVVDSPAVNDSVEKRKLMALNFVDITGILAEMKMKIGVGRISDPAAETSFRNIPFLVMDKIGIDSQQGRSRENGLLKRAVEGLRRVISGGKFGDLNSGKCRENGRGMEMVNRKWSGRNKEEN
ncbi:hypothetical protein PTKIN_Ptkin13bG0223400 [Pterospermum kingtungense]